MSTTDWNWRLAADTQDYPWDCAAASTAWALQACGLPYDEHDVILGLGSSRISPTYGLLDASGAGLVSYLAEIGVAAHNNPALPWGELSTWAGTQPVVIGGRNWYHWTAVRMSSLVAGVPELNECVLMNPAPGWMGIQQLLDENQFDYLGPFSAVWLDDWPGKPATP